jgi:uncharacterized protein (DUF934 family)
MPLLKGRNIVEDAWTLLVDGLEIPEAGFVIVSLDRFTRDRDLLVACSGPIGVRLSSAQSPQLIVDALEVFSLIELEFPAFTDGRSYSYAQLLHRLGFAGEIRAVGNVLRDQYLNLKRCGFDALEIKEGETTEDWSIATGAFSAPYQVAYDTEKPIMSLREQRLAAAS